MCGHGHCGEESEEALASARLGQVRSLPVDRCTRSSTFCCCCVARRRVAAVALVEVVDEMMELFARIRLDQFEWWRWWWLLVV